MDAVEIVEDASSTVGLDGKKWAKVRETVPAGSWCSLGALMFPACGVEEHVAVAGVIGVRNQEEMDHVHLWCPDVDGAWVPLTSFLEKTKGVRFAGGCPIWAKNTLDREVDVDVRVQIVRESDQAATAPDGTNNYYASKVWKTTTWLGVPVLKCPLDLWVMQEIIHEVKPDLIIETGTFMGGSALYFASVLDAIGKGFVTTVDVEEKKDRPVHPRICYVRGSSVDTDVLYHMEVEHRKRRTLVVLDSDHSYDHVLEELEAYAPLVSPGSYLVVEDTNTPGPSDAVRDFLYSVEGSHFTVDRSREKFGTSFNNGGWLRKKGGL